MKIKLIALVVENFKSTIMLFNNFRTVKMNVREESNKDFIILRVLHIQHVSRRIFLKFTNFSYCSPKCRT